MRTLFETRSAWLLGVLMPVALLGSAACGTSTTGGVCGAAATVSMYCGGFEVPSEQADACEGRVATACTDAEEAAYEAYLSCAADRCRNDSPQRQIGPSCDHLLAAVSPACFTAGVTGNSDYRYCAGGVDTCRSGFTCSPQTGTCQPE